jgi:hypothetical protein
VIDPKMPTRAYPEDSYASFTGKGFGASEWKLTTLGDRTIPNASIATSYRMWDATPEIHLLILLDVRYIFDHGFLMRVLCSIIFSKTDNKCASQT